MWENIGEWIGLAGDAISIFSSAQKKESIEDVSQANATKTSNYYKRLSEEKMRAAEENAKLYQYDAYVAEQEAEAVELITDIKLRKHAEQTSDLISTQRANYGKSGVSVSTGSPVDVVADTAAKGARDAVYIKYEGDTAANVRRSLSQRYVMLKDKSLREATYFASVMADASVDDINAIMADANARSKAAEYEMWGNVAKGVYDVGETEDWWS